MCRKVTCTHCKKATWAGCGLHIEAALASTKESDRCAGYKTKECPSKPEGYQEPGSCTLQ